MKIEKVIGNKALFQACKNILDQKSPRPFVRSIKVENGKFYACNAHCLMVSDISIPDGCYKPISVNKKEIVLEEIENCDYPSFEILINTEFKLKATVEKECIFDYSASVLSITAGIPINDMEVAIAKSLKLHAMNWKEKNDPIMFEGNNTKLYTMPLNSKGIEVRYI